MKTRLSVCFLATVLLVACNKKEPETTETGVTAVKTELLAACGQEIIADKPVKAGETGIILPVGTKLCITNDQLEVRVELPAGYAFLSKVKMQQKGRYRSMQLMPVIVVAKAAPAMYSILMALVSDACKAAAQGSCTGKFTYKGYSVDRVVSTSSKEEFFNLPDVKLAISQACEGAIVNEPYTKLSVFGVHFYLVKNEEIFLAKASCYCDGTKACTLKTLGITDKFSAQSYKIYYCDGPCNGCELTVN